VKGAFEHHRFYVRSLYQMSFVSRICVFMRLTTRVLVLPGLGTAIYLFRDTQIYVVTIYYIILSIPDEIYKYVVMVKIKWTYCDREAIRVLLDSQNDGWYVFHFGNQS
jgi:hypothetical protein